MEVYEAIKRRRTIRKFKQQPIAERDITEIIDAARLAPYGANLQPLKFAVIEKEELRKRIYPMIKYAGYLPEWDPEFDECPPVFIAVLNDRTIKPTEKTECDSGAAVMSMCLAAEAKGIGSCWLGAIDRNGIKSEMGLDDSLDVTYLLGLGYPDQSGSVCEMRDSVKYYFDDNGNVIVPKRSLKDIIVKI